MSHQLRISLKYINCHKGVIGLFVMRSIKMNRRGRCPRRASHLAVPLIGPDDASFFIMANHSPNCPLAIPDAKKLTSTFPGTSV